jgi:hypothetical protein
MQACGYDAVTPLGTAAARLFKSLSRLHDWPYRPGIAGTARAQSEGWPGDWEGRALLALALLGRTLKTEPAWLEELAAWIGTHCNEKGYRGAGIEPDAINEQSLAGHGWLLRGLIEYTRWKPDPAAQALVEAIVTALYLPLRGAFDSYPCQPQQRVYAGEAVGALAGTTVAGWQVSSDTGCAFIALDGLTQAYEQLRWPALKELIEEMIGVFTAIDFTGISMQTHATLTASRGVMRMYRLTGEERHLSFCRRIFEEYKREGMTENYANFNWFRRPSWTEPCGVVDSFLLALSLWEATGEASYLEDAHLIWYNGLCREQRPNGGFGCDSCATDGFVRVQEGCYEAFWCCTMRGCEGLAAAAAHGLYTQGDRLVFPFYSDGRYAVGQELVLRMRAQYPRAGCIEVTAERAPAGGVEKTLEFFLPDWAADIRLTAEGQPLEARREQGFVKARVRLQPGMRVRLEFHIPLLACPAITAPHKGSGLVTLRRGVLLLGSGEGGEAVRLEELEDCGFGRCRAGGRVFAPLDEAYQQEEAALKAASYRILFRVS